MKSTIVPAVALVVATGMAVPAYAAWNANGSGSAGSTAEVMPSGSKPTGTGSGTTVRVTWSAVKMSGGDAVAGYVISRYNATTHAKAAVGGACAGVVTATSCSETG